MESEDSLLCSEKFTTGTYHEPDQSSAHPDSIFL